MSITVSIMSKERGKINNFFKNHFKEQADIDDSVVEWIYSYKKDDIEKVLNVVDTVMDNSNMYDISLWLQISNDDIIKITKSNRKKLTNKILHLNDN